MKRFLVCFLILVVLLSGCNATSTTVSEPKTLTVFAASSLTNAFEEIGNAFEADNPGVSIVFNFSGSQALRTQIEEGANADVFASANMKEMDALVAGNFVAVNSAQIILTNHLVVIMPANNPAGLTTLADLSKPGLKIVLAAKEVPVGNYALQVLDKLDPAIGNGYMDKVIANVVSYENDVKQVVAKIQLGEADAGFVYSSDTKAATELKRMDIPVVFNLVAKYPMAAITKSRFPELGQAFISYVLSSKGQAILQNWGFQPIR